jgi:hypothetical protein
VLILDLVQMQIALDPHMVHARMLVSSLLTYCEGAHLSKVAALPAGGSNDTQPSDGQRYRSSGMCAVCSQPQRQAHPGAPAPQ